MKATPPPHPQAAEYAVFSVCNLGYLPKALVLAETLWRLSRVRLTVVIFDRKVPLDGIDTPATLRWIEDMDVPGFERLAFRYDIIELSTSLKPLLTLQLLETAEKVIFLDADTCTYASLAPIVRDLDEHAILLTPHYTVPEPAGEWRSDLNMMRFGSFNLGFFGVRKTTEAVAFLRWWSARCLQLGFYETQFGLSTDQKWVSIAPCFFPDLKVSFHLGYNAAPWNLHERHVARWPDGGYRVNNEFPLIFFHFSNFDPADPGYGNNRFTRERGTPRADVEELGRAYGRLLERHGTELASRPYSFDFMSGGEYISPTLRRAYAAIEAELPAGHDPFDSAGDVGRFARRNHLFERTRAARYQASGLDDLAQHERALGYVYALMRVVLRLVGPNRFYDLSRLLVFLSSFRQHRRLWKYDSSSMSG